MQAFPSAFLLAFLQAFLPTWCDRGKSSSSSMIISSRLMSSSAYMFMHFRISWYCGHRKERRCFRERTAVF